MSQLTVETQGARPVVVDVGDGPCGVISVVESWKVEVGWWRTPPARWERRSCWRVLLTNGSCLDIYWDELRRSWRLARSWG